VFNLGMGEITVILLLALIFLGPKKLPELASGLGKIIRDIRKATSDVKNEIQLDDTFRKPFEELRDAVTLHPDELKRRDEIKRELEAQRRKMEELAAAEAAAAEATPPPEGLPPPSGSAVVPPPPVSTTTPPPPPTAAISSAPSPAPEGTQGVVMSSAPPPAPVVPTAPPSGTFARHTPVRPPTRLGAPRVTPPVSMLASEQANKTQSLSEEDLSPPTPGPATLPLAPPPPPVAALGKRPPLPPGTPKAPLPGADTDKKKA
jgi:sec-independent protein translocase protein TatB